MKSNDMTRKWKKAVWIIMALGLFGLSACSTRYIEGTKIPDSDEAREVIQVVEIYRKALERRDVDFLAAMASPRYFEKNGNSNSQDNYDFNGLLGFLQSPEFRSVSQVRMKNHLPGDRFQRERDRRHSHLQLHGGFQDAPAAFSRDRGSAGKRVRGEGQLRRRIVVLEKRSEPDDLGKT